MEMLDRYLYEIGRRLPAKQKEDILKELNTLLLDSIDEGIETQEGSLSEEEVAAKIIQDFGSPKKVAERYASNNYLVGPRFYETYITVLKIVLTVIVVLIGASFLISILVSNFGVKEFAKQIIGILPSSFSGIISTVGIVTIIFAIIERSADDTHWPLKEQSFDPFKLPEVPSSKEKIKYSSVIADLVGAFFTLALLNAFSDKLNIYNFANHGQSYIISPLFNPERFSAYLPFWNALIVASIVISAIILKNGRNTKFTSIAGIIISLLTAVALSTVIYDPNLLTVSQPNFTGELKAIYPLLITGIKTSFAIAVTAIVVVTGFQIFKFIKK